MATAAEMLTQVEAAITALLNSNVKNYSIGDRSVTRVDLAELRIWRAELQREVAAGNGTGVCRSGFDR